MTRLIYDGTFEGLLTVVFEVYAHRLTEVSLQREGAYSSAMFEDVQVIITDNARAKRVLNGLRQKLSVNAVKRLYIAHLGEIAQEENNLLGYIRYVFDAGRNIEENYANKYVLRVAELVKMMHREKHRMEAFIRFQKLKDETFYAVIEPDFNVLPLLTDHFKSRYADQKWIIYDISRNYGLYYDLHDTEFITLEFTEVSKAAATRNAFAEQEEVYQHLWKNYFQSVNISSRKNMKLHIRHIPRRYWKHLTEKI